MNSRFIKLKNIYKVAFDEEVAGFKDNNLTLSSTQNNDKGLVSYVQNKLIEAGYQLPIYGSDGVFGKETKEAIIAFKKDHGLPPNSTLSGQELSILESATASKITRPISPNQLTDEGLAKGQSLLFGDSQMQGGIGMVLEQKYGGKRLAKAGSNANYWSKNEDLKQELLKKPARIIIQLNSNGIAGTDSLISLIKSITPTSRVIWYGAPPAVLQPNSDYKQVKKQRTLESFNQTRESMNSAVASLLASSRMNYKFIDPFKDIFKEDPAYICQNCDGVHVPREIAQKFYA